ncbi:MAG TPA: SDR family NAD(P)-dependent oxidoreductase, partial [Trueperaceae bacterium]|nr:SDR family NAD(P)-dependent oxidoreductase [Trueperaceae bacterium]
MNDELSGKLVAVTGASGGIGHAAVVRLLAAGARVRGLTRSEAGAERLAAAGAEVVRGDLLEASALQELFRGADLALHLAAWMGGKGGVREARRVNVDGARQVVAAAAAAGTRRLVHVSSVAVYGPSLQGEVDESNSTRAVGDPYGDTKLEGEEAAREAGLAAGIELVVLRPTMVYGPWIGSWTLTPLNALKAGVPLAFGDGRFLLDAVYVDDVARAAAMALVAPGAAGQAFNVTGAPTTWDEFLGAYAAMLGRPLRHLPTWLVRGGARVAGAVTRPLGQARVVPEMTEVMLSHATFSGDKAAEKLGYRAQVPLEEGMRATARWLRAEGHLHRPRA